MRSQYMASAAAYRWATDVSTGEMPHGEVVALGISGDSPANKPRDGFFPDPDLIVTEHAHELSGIFIALQDMFSEQRLVDAEKNG